MIVSAGFSEKTLKFKEGIQEIPKRIFKHYEKKINLKLNTRVKKITTKQNKIQITFEEKFSGKVFEENFDSVNKYFSFY